MQAIFLRGVAEEAQTLADDVDAAAVCALLEAHTSRAWRAEHNGRVSKKLLRYATTARDERLPPEFTKAQAETLHLIDVERAAKALQIGSM